MLASWVVTVFGMFLIVLGCVALARPRTFRSFLSGFAQSARVHGLEMSVRLLVGAALIASAGSGTYGAAFRILGWILLGSTAVLMLIPWRWHQTFANRVVPTALQFTPIIGGSSIAMGCLVLYAQIAGAIIMD